MKLNENLNNISENKSNRKKSTNGNSIIEEGDDNLDNESLLDLEKGKNKFGQSPKKNKLFLDNDLHLKYKIPKDTISKKSNEEKDEDFVFEYLKNQKIFIDELIINNIPKKEENNNENIDTNKLQEESENIIEKDNMNLFSAKRNIKNSIFSDWSNIYDDEEEEDDNKKNDGDLISEIEIFMRI